MPELNREVLKKLEARTPQRKISLDEWLAFAVVFDVSPLVLLLPTENVPYQFAPVEHLAGDASDVLDWLVSDLGSHLPYATEVSALRLDGLVAVINDYLRQQRPTTKEN